MKEQQRSILAGYMDKAIENYRATHTEDKFKYFYRTKTFKTIADAITDFDFGYISFEKALSMVKCV